ncbi:oxygen-independent coproporphyrinogen III oxidase [Sediminibacterium soli]|uniref:oxygen-independent coproporphyrinogen III oxidase n=1 Tax=Sediminibacterium soli TaxID=2698829 RepID=UPI00137A909F|nr:oxygen-independent coproporphyrinogen III oxidase [Sediminibacterium soli]NCI47015.1 oxygen-independent coproporphyrinogen III oxidase [Sediminibacterium soli]
MNHTPPPELIHKYNRPVPRYTSYPTVPFWKNDLPENAWQARFVNRFGEANTTHGLSLYIHLPFCESLCTYCGCNKKITRNHEVEPVYIAAVKKEWQMYRGLMNQAPKIRSIHLGGGTPTFFSPGHLEELISFIMEDSLVAADHQFSVEGHPNNTTETHLSVLARLGFTRVSYGVQDNDPEVQHIINRIQPLANVAAATAHARSNGFSSVNFDLIYGLPKQTLQSMEKTMNQVISLRPDRIAFYSYAHVPWTSRGQRLFDQSDLPGAEEKTALYAKGKEVLLAGGYADIGMDHFALPSDELFKARQEGRLHRNFMGYTDQTPGLLLGLGVSSISDSGDAFAQNHKTLHDYYEAIARERFPFAKGYLLTEEDHCFRNNILDIICKGRTGFLPSQYTNLQQYSFPALAELEQDGLVKWNDTGLSVTEAGHYFLRNICAAFDMHLQRSGQDGQTQPQFSKAI